MEIIADGGRENTIRNVEKERGEYQYFARLDCQKDPRQCHRNEVPADANIKEGDLMRVVEISLPGRDPPCAGPQRAILLATGIGTAFLACSVVRHRPLRDRQAGATSQGRQRPDCPWRPRPAGRHSHRRRIRRLSTRSIACSGTWSPFRRSCGGVIPTSTPSRPIASKPAAVRIQQAQGRFSGHDEPRAADAAEQYPRVQRRVGSRTTI